MQRLILILGAILVLALTAAPVLQAADVKDPLEKDRDRGVQRVVNQIAAQVVAGLPDDIHFRLLAIGPIEGDDGRLADALTVRIKADTNYHLIERRDLNRLLEEQGIQVSPVADPRRPIEPGRIRGVEGLLMGKIVRKQDTVFFSRLEVFLKLDNVETGTIVFARNFSARHLPQTTIYAGIAVLALLFLGLCANALKKRRNRKIERLVEDDTVALVGMADELHKAKELVNQAHDRLVQSNRMQQSTAVRKAREDLGYLLDRVGQAPAVYAGAVRKATPAAVRAHDKSLQRLAKNVVAESDALLEAAKTRGDTGIDGAVERLRTEINQTMAKFQERPVGKS